MMNNRPSPLSPTEATIETLKSASSRIRELNRMLDEMTESIRSARLELAASRKRREDGEDNA